MEQDKTTNRLQRQCALCLYFREHNYVGYCQLHEMHVLKSFDCSKFELRPGCVPAEDAYSQAAEDE